MQIELKKRFVHERLRPECWDVIRRGSCLLFCALSSKIVMIFLSFMWCFMPLKISLDTLLKPFSKEMQNRIKNKPSANVSPDINSLKDHKTQQQIAQELVENTRKLTCKTSYFFYKEKDNCKGLIVVWEIDQTTFIITDDWSRIIWPQMWCLYLNFLSVNYQKT